MHKYVHIILLLLAPIALAAQFENDYKPVVSTGTLPKDFVTLSSDKYIVQKAELEKNESKTVSKSKEDFLIKSNYGVDEMLLSGKVIFNDPLSDYVNKVADNLLQDDRTLRSQLRFYVLRSSVVNAFATNQGVIFVTMGLLAQVENEAQLAFIIAHETAHYVEKHAIQQYLEAEKIEGGKGDYEDLTFDDKDIAKCAFTKEQEKDADVKGIEMFLRSKYSTQNVMGVYDVLKYAYLPFDDITFDKSFLETAYMKFPEGYVPLQTKAIETKDIDDNDKRSTHPSVPERRAYTEKAIKKGDNTGKSDYRVGETEFKRIREMARFELCRLYTLNHRYEAGIYTSYMLLKKHPKNLYLKKNVAYCLAGLSEYSNKEEFSAVHIKSSDIEGKGQAVYQLMQKLDSVKGDINVVAFAYVAALKQKHSNDREIEELYHRLMLSLINDADRKYHTFSEEPPLANTLNSDTAEVIKISEIKEAAPADEMSTSKYEKLRQQENEIKQTGKRHFTDYALLEFMEDGKLMSEFDKASREKTKKSKIDLTQVYGKKNKSFAKKVFALGIDKIVVVDPYFMRVDARKKDKQQYLQSEIGQVDFAERLKTNAEMVKLNIEVLNTKNLLEVETEKMNEISILGEYITERLNHSKGILLPYAEKERVRAIAKKYDTNNFMWAGAISITKNSVANKTVFFTLLYDVEKDELTYATYREIKNRTKAYILDAHIYDSLLQIKSKKKEKKTEE